MRYSLFVSLLLLAIAGVVGLAWESHEISQRRASRRIIEAQTAELESRDRADRREYDSMQAELATMETEIAAQEAKRDPAEVAMEKRVLAWVGKVDRVRSYFAAHPELTVPQMARLSVTQWLSLSANVDFDGDEVELRRNLARFRTSSRTTVNPLLRDALRKYVTVNDGSLPNTVADIAPFLTEPIAPEILARYHIVAGGRVGEIGAAVDDQFDARWYFYPTGGRAQQMLGWVQGELQESVWAAEVEYAKANGGRAESSQEDLLQYIPSPVHRAYLEAEAAFYRANPGRRPPLHQDDLLPLLTQPDARAFAARILAK